MGAYSSSVKCGPGTYQQGETCVVKFGDEVVINVSNKGKSTETLQLNGRSSIPSKVICGNTFGDKSGPVDVSTIGFDKPF